MKREIRKKYEKTLQKTGTKTLFPFYLVYSTIV